MPPSKRGLSWPVANPTPLHPFTKPGSKISWLYNWSPVRDATCSQTSLQFIPMQWNAVDIDNLASKIHAGTPDQPPALLAYNEPELPDQANMTAEFAAAEWLRCIEPLRHGQRPIRCGSPAISSAGHAVGWLKDFLARVRAGGGDVDFYCLHWYGETLGQFYDYIWSAYYQLGNDKPVWITEFAATNWNEQHPLPTEHVEAFAKASCEYLEGLEWVERFAWFGPMRDVGTVGRGARMVDDAGGLTALGVGYRNG